MLIETLLNKVERFKWFIYGSVDGSSRFIEETKVKLGIKGICRKIEMQEDLHLTAPICPIKMGV